jgi:hypothetical protein
METKKERTQNRFGNAPVQLTFTEGKGTECLGKTATRVYDLLMRGGQYSVVDICKALNVSDPRSHIRKIRNAGIAVSDYWMESSGARFKMYFIR